MNNRLEKLTNLNDETILVRLDQIACAYPTNLFGSEEDLEDFAVSETACTRVSMMNGEILHVKESADQIWELSQG